MVQGIGRIYNIIKKLVLQLGRLKDELQKGHNVELEAYYLITKGELQCWEKRKETRATQLAKKKWLKEGDNNSKFFHVVINQRRNSSQIDFMHPENGFVWATSTEIREGAIAHFQKFPICYH